MWVWFVIESNSAKSVCIHPPIARSRDLRRMALRQAFTIYNFLKLLIVLLGGEKADHISSQPAARECDPAEAVRVCVCV